MAKNKISEYSSTADDNTDVGNIDIEGSDNVANFDNALRTIMSHLADMNAGTSSIQDTLTIADPADDTKKVRIDAGGVTAGQTRVLASPDKDGTVALAGDVLDLAGTQAMTGDLDMGGNDIEDVKSLNGGPLGGYRNKIINGDFDIWQRGTSQTSSGYDSVDRWDNVHTGSTKTTSRQAFTAGQTDVPGNPRYFCRADVTTASTSGSYVLMRQNVEDVSTLAGKTATLTFWSKADASKSIALEASQLFGSGGSPSSQVITPIQKVDLTTSWQKFSIAFSVPSISGKTLGTNDDSRLQIVFWLEAGSSLNSRTDSIGNQSGTFDIAHVSLVEGDATLEDDPFEPRHIGQELILCQRYYEKVAYTLFAMQYRSTNRAIDVHFRVSKRTTPTITLTAGVGTFSAASVGIDGFYTTIASSYTEGSIYYLSGYEADAEL